ncbi:phosphate ABC transporter substrate-binding protein PstS family protein [Apilactobacillus apisilvae]|uniref:Phosphate-binding protein n=1 Tax=Apilactobacillus apisilvae TaxID=2923364 RepID=A0ABY4PJU6_9LACO|nr:phosphate ABC transporter substrate-binding protein PstS family protein [Apilactobacillus apisilvae]UQS85587.1 phosphate ABC transporter substrate-binding protein PstS family protein [Apilactobacillus apisilvae]
MLNLKKFIAIISVFIISGALLTACGSSSSKTKITVVGSTALQPLVEETANEYQEGNNNVSITVQGGGSGTGLSQLQSKAVTIGNSDVFAENQNGIDAKKMIDHKVAVVGMAPVLNKSIGVKNLSMSQLRAIFTGEIQNWKQVGGKNQKIEVINRVKGSGTRATFEDNVLKGKSAIKSQEQDSNGTVKRIVASTPGAISYLAFSFIDKTLQPVSIDNIQPNDKNVEDNSWKIWSYEHMYTNKDINKETKKFLEYVQSKNVQNSLVKKLGYISIHNMKVTKDDKNKIIE